MRATPLKNLLKLMSADMSDKERAGIRKVLGDTKLRNKLIKELQAKGIGKGIDPDNLEKWIELFLKYLPQVLAIILQLVG